MPPVERSRPPLGSFLRLLWQAPLYAIPFAVFFGTLYGARGRAYVEAYQLALVFSYAIMATLWAGEVALMPRLRAAFPEWQPSTLIEGLVHMGMALVGSALGALLVHNFVAPGFLGSGRGVAVVLMFSLLFAGLVTASILTWQLHKSAIQHARAGRELELAREIQRSFLPDRFPTSPLVEVHAVNVPSRVVSGDFYDVVTGAGGLLLAVADVEGKSIPAAILTGMLQASLRAQQANVLADIVANINTLVCQRAGELQQFATFFLARVDEKRNLTYVNAGHNPPFLFRAAGERLLLDRGGIMLGVLDAAPFEEGKLVLGPGDRVVIYTDGITERTNPKGEEYGPERLAALVGALPPRLSAREVTESVLRGLEQFAEGSEPADDQTLLVLSVRG